MPKYDSVRKMGYLRNDKIYSGNTRLKKVPESGAKINPTRILWGLIYYWRMGRDSNPRWSCPHNGFQDRRNRPLCHPSETFFRRSFKPTVLFAVRTWRCCSPLVRARLRCACLADSYARPSQSTALPPIRNFFPPVFQTYGFVRCSHLAVLLTTRSRSTALRLSC